MPDITYLDTYIKDGKNEMVSLKNLYDTLLLSSTDRPDHIYRVPFSDFFLQHSDELKGAMALYQITESRFYKPKMVSLELYGTTELWLALLRANNMRNITEFHYPLIKIYHPAKLQEFINIFFKREGKSI